jgi:uncharacterized protein (DUF2336 family)
MAEPASRFALLKNLNDETSSDTRRELLRQVTDALGSQARPPSDAEFAELDQVLAAVAQEYSLQVRTEFSRLVAASVTRFCQASERFALDDQIEVAAPVLRHSQALSEDVLLRVVREKSQAHMMAVTQRSMVPERVSDVLVERGDDAVVTSLLKNERALIGEAAYEKLSLRSDASPALRPALVGRKTVPLDVLHGLYQKVEGDLRREILKKFDGASPQDLEKAFERSRARLTDAYRSMPPDFDASSRRVVALQAGGKLNQPTLAALLREGAPSRTAFKLAFARLTDVPFEVVDRAVEQDDLDTIALLCRGARFDRGLFVSLAIGLDKSDRGLAAAEQFGQLYESVPIQAAQRALRFWKVRAA